MKQFYQIKILNYVNKEHILHAIDTAIFNLHRGSCLSIREVLKEYNYKGPMIEFVLDEYYEFAKYRNFTLQNVSRKGMWLYGSRRNLLELFKSEILNS